MKEEIYCYELKALESAKFLQEFCKNHKTCECCIFNLKDDDVYSYCGLRRTPCEYNFKIEVAVE